MTEEELQLQHFGILGMQWGRRKGSTTTGKPTNSKKSHNFYGIKFSQSEKKFLIQNGPTIKKGLGAAALLIAAYGAYKMTHYPSALSMVDGVLTLTMPPGSITRMADQAQGFLN